MARLDWRVELANKVTREHRLPSKERSDEAETYLKTIAAPNRLFDNARAVQRQMRIGCVAFGGWTGLVIGLSLITASIRRLRKDYTADAGTCVACARCYQTCPVEHARRTGQSVEDIIKQAQAVA